MKSLTSLLLTLALFALFTYVRSLQTPPSQPATLGAANPTIAPRIKTTECVAQNGLPDHACTPGAIFPEVTKDQICVPGYSKQVRNVPTELKNEVFAEYGIASHQPGEYEVDHLISLELGGSNDIANLWPEVAEPRPGFHEKDTVENFLHNQVCNGTLTLQDAQSQIASHWVSVYQSLNTKPLGQ